MDTYSWLSIIGAGAWTYPLGVAIHRVAVKPKIRISPGENVQIGYTGLGPIVNLHCAISTRRKDALIERIEAVQIIIISHGQ